MSRSDGVTFINVLAIAADQVDDFIERWQQRSTLLTGAAGFRGAQLHRALSADTEFLLVNIARWDSAETFDNAIADPRFRTALAEFRGRPGLDMTPHRGLYAVAAVVDPRPPAAE